ncbi:MAG: hypothetical protein LBJ48_03990 [Coriobacteriales bacterium]|jgi:hypothetical protein|nr:hypothetical protein [Coriobacteriales bacterium]
MTKYRQKRGRITWRELFEIDPTFREWKLGNLSERAIESFLKQPAGQTPKLASMTASDYFNACLLGYRANKDEKSYDGSPLFKVEGLTAKQAYERNADGRDDGLLAIPENDAEAFKEWLLHREQRGGHPFEVMRGGNSTHVNLGVSASNEGFSYWLAGKNRIYEVVRFYNALSDAGLPVEVDQFAVISGVLTGDGCMYIVPQDILPRYCWYLFPGEKTEYYMNIPWDFTRSQTMKLIHRAHWYPDQTVEELVAEGDRLYREGH